MEDCIPMELLCSSWEMNEEWKMRNGEWQRYFQRDQPLQAESLCIKTFAAAFTGKEMPFDWLTNVIAGERGRLPVHCCEAMIPLH